MESSKFREEVEPMKIELLESFLTGHPDIDEDHRNLVDVINLVCDAIDANDLGKCTKLLNSFVEIAKNHFAKEENILRKVNYPGIEEHCVYHNELLKKVQKVKKICQEMGDQGLLKECFEEMAGFLIDDVVKGDHEFISHLINAGVAKKNKTA